MAILISKLRGIDAYSSTQRFFTEHQRLAMWGRDRGCTMIDCDRPLGWTDAHHVTDFKDTRRTSVDDGASVCGRDHPGSTGSLHHLENEVCPYGQSWDRASACASA